MSEENNVNVVEPVVVEEVAVEAAPVVEEVAVEAAPVVEEVAPVAAPIVEPVVEKHGIQETKDLVVELAKIGVASAKSIIAKSAQWGLYVDCLKGLVPAISGIKEIPAELKDLDSQESQELIDSILVELAPLGITDSAAAKHFIQAGKSIVEGTFSIIAGIQDLKK